MSPSYEKKLAAEFCMLISFGSKKKASFEENRKKSRKNIKRRKQWTMGQKSEYCTNKWNLLIRVSDC